MSKYLDMVFCYSVTMLLYRHKADGPAMRGHGLVRVNFVAIIQAVGKNIALEHIVFRGGPVNIKMGINLHQFLF